MIEIYSKNIDGIWFSVACSQQQIVASSFAASQQLTLSNILRNIPFNMPFEVFHEPSVFAKGTLSFLKNIYDGKNVNTRLSLAMTRLPTYTQKVLKATSQIHLGYVTSYGSIAQVVGGGPRAVGNVMASNPFPPIVPCHRVVKSDLTLGGYALGGLKVKVGLLAKEKQGFLEPIKIDVNGNKLEVLPVECVLKDLA